MNYEVWSEGGKGDRGDQLCGNQWLEGKLFYTA